MLYKVVNQPVEINGKIRQVGAVIHVEDFKPNETHTIQQVRNGVLEVVSFEWSEAESLLKSGHIIPADE